MAGQRTSIVCLVVTAAMLIQLTTAANYMVGSPNGGWDLATDIQSWATSQTFSVGDNLGKLKTHISYTCDVTVC